MRTRAPAPDQEGHDSLHRMPVRPRGMQHRGAPRPVCWRQRLLQQRRRARQRQRQRPTRPRGSEVCAVGCSRGRQPVSHRPRCSRRKLVAKHRARGAALVCARGDGRGGAWLVHQRVWRRRDAFLRVAVRDFAAVALESTFSSHAATELAGVSTPSLLRRFSVARHFACCSAETRCCAWACKKCMGAR